MSKRRAIWIGALAALILLIVAAGWLLRPQTQPTITGFIVEERDGLAALRFGNWVLVFEAIPAQSASIGAQGTINYPDPNGYGGSDSSIGGLKLKQAWDGQANAITVNGYGFKLTDAGRKLAFADRTYEAEGTTKTIVIAKDGTTREQANR